VKDWGKSLSVDGGAMRSPNQEKSLTGGEKTNVSKVIFLRDNASCLRSGAGGIQEGKKFSSKKNNLWGKQEGGKGSTARLYLKLN